MLPTRSDHIPALQAGDVLFNPGATDMADLTARAVVVKSKHRPIVRQRLRLAADTLKSPTCEMNVNLFHRTGAPRSHHIPALQAGDVMFKPIATDMADLQARSH